MGNDISDHYLQGNPSDDVQRVDDVPEGFAHLPPMSVPHHGVQINLLRSDAIIIQADRPPAEGR